MVAKDNISTQITEILGLISKIAHVLSMTAEGLLQQFPNSTKYAADGDILLFVHCQQPPIYLLALDWPMQHCHIVAKISQPGLYVITANTVSKIIFEHKTQGKPHVTSFHIREASTRLHNYTVWWAGLPKLLALLQVVSSPGSRCRRISN